MLFEPATDFGELTPRPYQVESLEAVHTHICNDQSNPLVVIPTGGGKSILIAWIIQRWIRQYKPFRVCILAHRKELVSQNSQELIDLWPTGDIGIFAAGLKRKDEDNAVIYASIGSIYKKAGIFPHFDALIIDEAHRIPARGEGKYRRFIKECTDINKNLKVIGFTATPFRMGCGPIAHRDHILNKICYEANIGDLINDGYLCKLRSKVAHEGLPDLSEVRRNSGGDYIVRSLAEAVDTPGVVADAVKEFVVAVKLEKRKSVIVFCVDVEHCRQVSQELRKYGIDAPFVTAKTPHQERVRIAEAFKAGRYQFLLNVNIYTEGFNAKRVDCIVLLRPTLSKGLFFQMVGRGLRLHPDKTDCLVLDFANCITEHGPIDQLDAGEVKLYECKECGDIFSKAVGICPNCQTPIPKIEVERMEAEERTKKMHEAKASERSILSSEPETYDVNSVSVNRHIKLNKPDSLRIEYRCGLSTFREWIALDHGGYAERKARSWWAIRFGVEESKEVTIDTALQDMFLGERINAVTREITVKREGKYTSIIDYILSEENKV